MILKSQRRIAAQLLKTGLNKVWFDPDRLEEIKEAITKADLRSLINDKAIQKRPERGVSRARARKRLIQRRKGRRQGTGSRKGKRTARLSRKRSWILQIRSQRNFLNLIRDKKIITPKSYSHLYRKAKGGFFRSKRHIRLYIKEHNLELKHGKK